MSPTRFLIAAAVLLATQAAAYAAPTLTLTAKIDARRIVGSTSNAQLINSSLYDTGYMVNGAGWTTNDYVIEVDAAITNLDPGHSFGSMAFDITLSGSGNIVNHPTTSLYNWKPNNPIWTNDAGDTSSQLFQIAGDKGTNSTDLASILAVVSQDASADSTGNGFGLDAADPRLTMLTPAGLTGYQAPMKIGTFEVQWTGASPLFSGGSAFIGITNVQFAQVDDATTQFGPIISNLSNPGSVVTNNAEFRSPPFYIEGTPYFYDAPEPASLALLATGALIALKRRNHR